MITNPSPRANEKIDKDSLIMIPLFPHITGNALDDMNLDDIDVAAFEKELDNDTSSVGSSGASIGQLPIGEYTNGVARSSHMHSFFNGKLIVYICSY